MKSEELSRFLDAQNQIYLRALEEIKAGRKETHWMWFIFPQIKGLGNSDTSKFYAIQDINEAKEYLKHPVLGKNLLEISKAVLAIEDKSAHEIFGSPDDMKLQSCMTLFSVIEGADPVFEWVLNKYFGGFFDSRTLRILEKNVKDDTI
jgi:uncharacterized protein (DUF1810 family)